MSSGKPASLDGSLLARKGSAVPAVPQDSPLTQELGEPRPQATIVAFDSPVGGESPAPETAAPAAEPVPSTGLSQTARRNILIAAVLVLLALLVFAAQRFASAPEGTTGQDARPAPVAEAPPESSPSAAEGPSPTPAPEPASAPAATPEPARASAVTLEPVEPAAPPAPAEPAGTDVPPAAAAGSPAPDSPAAEPAPPAPPVAAAAPIPPKKPVRIPPPVRPSPYLLQLGSLPSVKDAQTEMRRLQGRLSRTLGARTIVMVKAKGGDGQPVFRLRVAGYPSLTAARTACREVRQRKVGCLVVKR